MADEGVQPSGADGAVGAVLNGQWRLLRLVGEGGLAAVYEAESLQGQGSRAIKLLHPQFCSRPAVVERFYTEAKACYSLRHPHIASVEAYAYAEDGSPYIVMELLQGMSIEQFLAAGKTMSVDQALPVIAGILQGLSAAHARNIVHRDLKPANLFLVQEADRFSPKLLDFGVAKVMDLAGGMGSKTRTGALLGTPGYMSPEQVKDSKAVDARTDLWSVAVVAYELLTGRHPFDSEDKLSRMVAVLRDEPRPISQVRPELAAWDGFFQRGLAKLPDQRFQSAEQMADALRELGRHDAPAAPLDGRRTVALPQMSAPQPAAAPATQGSATVASMAASGTAAPAASVPAPGVPTTAPGSEALGASRPDDKSLPIELGVPVGGVEPTGRPAGLPPMQPPAGAQRTQISGDRPAGTPTYISGEPPAVPVETARDIEPPRLVWWGVVLVGLGCLALGVLLGYLLGSG